MIRRLSTVAGTALVLCAMSSAAFCEDIVIGYVDDLSGASAESGTDALHAVELVVEMANAAGGIDGRQIKLITYDGKTDPQLTATYVTRLADDDNALVIIGGIPSAATAAAFETANEIEIPYLGLSAAVDSFTEPATPYYFRFGHTNSQDAKAVVDMIVGQGFKNVAIINNSLPFGLDGGKAMADALMARGVNIVAHETYDVNAADLVPTVLRIRDAKPQLTVAYGYPADGGRLLQTIKQLDVGGFVVMPRMLIFESLRRIAGASAEGVLINNTADLDRADVQTFLTAYREKFGNKPPAFYIFQAHDAAQAALRLAAQTDVRQLLDADDIRAARRAARDAVEMIGSFPSLQGTQGMAYNFTADDHQGPPDSNDFFIWLTVNGFDMVKADMSQVKPN